MLIGYWLITALYCIMTLIAIYRMLLYRLRLIPSIATCFRLFSRLDWAEIMLLNWSWDNTWESIFCDAVGSKSYFFQVVVANILAPVWDRSSSLPESSSLCSMPELYYVVCEPYVDIIYIQSLYCHCQIMPPTHWIIKHLTVRLEQDCYE